MGGRIGMTDSQRVFLFAYMQYVKNAYKTNNYIHKISFSEKFTSTYTSEPLFCFDVDCSEVLNAGIAVSCRSLVSKSGLESKKLVTGNKNVCKHKQR